MRHIITCTVFETKAGGWRAAFKDRTTGQIERADVESKSAGIVWCKQKTIALVGREYAPGYVYKPDWLMNVYV